MLAEPGTPSATSREMPPFVLCFAALMPRNLPQKSNDFLSAKLPAVPLRRSMLPLLSKATFTPFARYASAVALVGSTLVAVVGLDSNTTP